MLQKISVDEISSYQSYTIRRLDQQQSKMPDSEQYKLKEDALSNKLKYLDVLCFPTLFPSGRFGESHPRKVPITPSEFAKSHLLNKDGRFRKDDLYVFYLLWQKEMRDLGAGIYNLLKGTRQQAMPVQDFLDQLSKSNQEVEANLSTVFQSIRGSKQYWFHRKSEVLCMVQEYGSPTLFLTLSCAEYDSIEISTYLRKVNNVSAHLRNCALRTQFQCRESFHRNSMTFLVFSKDKHLVLLVIISTRRSTRPVEYHTTISQGTVVPCI